MAKSKSLETYGESVAVAPPAREAIVVECCSRCEYEVRAHCHRYPPIMTLADFAFPTVFPHDWCGEFKPRR